MYFYTSRFLKCHLADENSLASSPCRISFPGMICLHSEDDSIVPASEEFGRYFEGMTKVLGHFLLFLKKVPLAVSLLIEKILSLT